MSLVLELDLTSGLREEPPTDPLERLTSRGELALPTLLDRLRDAAADPMVVGLVAKLGQARMSLAHAQELRDAVVEFRRSGKPSIAWAETFGELGRGTVPYVLATGFDEIWLQPSGGVGLVGTATMAVFAREALDRADVEPLVARRHEYKGAAETFLRRELSDPLREATTRLAQSSYEQVVATVAEGRGLAEAHVRELIDAAPLSAGEAQSGGLVDHLGYHDGVRQELDRRSREEAARPGRAVPLRERIARLRREDEPALVYAARYQRRGAGLRQLRSRRQRGVALIFIGGPIRQGRSVRGPLGRGTGADTVAAAIRSAVADEHTGAIVLRVNSPGGSYVASDTIWREVCRAREAGKPVVASMAEVAASGGYFVSMGAELIVALPATLTGSIGVLAGKLRTEGLLQRLGVHVDGVAAGAHAQMFSPLTGFTDGEWARLNAWLDEVYDDFVGKVASARGMTARPCTRWPEDGSGRAPIRASAGSSTSSEASSVPSRSPGNARAFRRTPPSGSTRPVRRSSCSRSHATVTTPPRPPRCRPRPRTSPGGATSPRRPWPWGCRLPDPSSCPRCAWPPEASSHGARCR